MNILVSYKGKINFKIKKLKLIHFSKNEQAAEEIANHDKHRKRN